MANGWLLCFLSFNFEVNAGTSDNATKLEIMTAPASTPPNSLNNRPAVEGKNAIGIKTAANTAVVATTAKNTSRVPITADARRPSPSPL